VNALARCLNALVVVGMTAVTSLARADLAPQVMSAGGGMLDVSTYSASYLPQTTRVGVMQAGLDGHLSQRWSIWLRTTSSVDETLNGAAGGLVFNLRPHRTITTGGTDGLTQTSTTVTPGWNARLGLGVGRWSYAQVLELNDRTRPASLRETPVKAAVYGPMLRATLSRSFGTRWSADAEYDFVYAAANGFSLLVQTLTLGPSYWF
jgi:hypothetical protein